jgi:hypothetical protein
MPTISAFRGIFIRIYYDDHSPPHFHALYQGDEAKVAIETSDIINGYLPSRTLRHVLSWTEAHRLELHENWDRAQRHAPLVDIPPLE